MERAFITNPIIFYHQGSACGVMYNGKVHYLKQNIDYNETRKELEEMIKKFTKKL